VRCGVVRCRFEKCGCDDCGRAAARLMRLRDRVDRVHPPELPRRRRQAFRLAFPYLRRFFADVIDAARQFNRGANELERASTVSSRTPLRWPSSWNAVHGWPHHFSLATSDWAGPVLSRFTLWLVSSPWFFYGEGRRGLAFGCSSGPCGLDNVILFRYELEAVGGWLEESSA